MLNETIETIVSKLENLVNSKTVIGEPTVVGNVTIIPVISASFGFGTGSGEGTEQGKESGKGGGAGAGAKVTPCALLVIQDGETKVYSMGQKGTLERLAEIVPEIMSKHGGQGSSQ